MGWVSSLTFLKCFTIHMGGFRNSTKSVSSMSKGLSQKSRQMTVQVRFMRSACLRSPTMTPTKSGIRVQSLIWGNVEEGRLNSPLKTNAQKIQLCHPLVLTNTPGSFLLVGVGGYHLSLGHSEWSSHEHMYLSHWIRQRLYTCPHLTVLSRHSLWGDNDFIPLSIALTQCIRSSKPSLWPLCWELSASIIPNALKNKAGACQLELIL